MIHSTGHGSVDFTLPYLRDYLREYAATAGSDHSRRPFRMTLRARLVRPQDALHRQWVFLRRAR